MNTCSAPHGTEPDEEPAAVNVPDDPYQFYRISVCAYCKCEYGRTPDDTYGRDYKSHGACGDCAERVFGQP